jgi:hypothetical protein
MRHLQAILEQVSGEIPTDEATLSQLGRTDKKLWADIAERTTSTSVTADLRWALSYKEEGFTRQDILDIEDPDAATGRRRRFIATLMWGYGTADLRYPARVSDLIQLFDGAQLDERLSDCVSALHGADLVRAYESLTGIRNLKSAYFTKYLYFAGKAIAPTGQYPLILDTKVSNRLARLTGYSYYVITDQWPHDDAKTYVNYVRLMHALAKDINVSADALEFYLFERPSQHFADACDAAYWVAS